MQNLDLSTLKRYLQFVRQQQINSLQSGHSKPTEVRPTAMLSEHQKAQIQ